MQNNFNHLADTGWADMHRMLDKELPEKKKRRFAIWWWVLPLLIGGAILGYSMHNNKSNAANIAIAPVKAEGSYTNLNDDLPVASMSNPVNLAAKSESGKAAEITKSEKDGILLSDNRPGKSEIALSTPENMETLDKSFANMEPKDEEVKSPLAVNLPQQSPDVNQSVSEDISERVILSSSYLPLLQNLELSANRSFRMLQNISIVDNTKHSDFFLQTFLGAETAIPSNFKGYTAGLGLGKDLGRYFSVAGNVGIRRLHYTSSNKSELQRSFEDEASDINAGGIEDFDMFNNNLSRSDLIDDITYLDFNLNVQHRITTRFGIMLDAGISRLLSVNNIFSDVVNSSNANAIGGISYAQNGKKFLEETHVLNNTLWSVDLGLFYNINDQFSIQASYGIMTNNLLADNNVADLQLSSDETYKYRALALQMTYRFLDFE